MSALWIVSECTTVRTQALLLMLFTYIHECMHTVHRVLYVWLNEMMYPISSNHRAISNGYILSICTTLTNNHTMYYFRRLTVHTMACICIRSHRTLLCSCIHHKSKLWRENRNEGEIVKKRYRNEEPFFYLQQWFECVTGQCPYFG